MLDERWIRSLHVEAMREQELHAEREPHVLFQASTIGALLDGAYDGDLSFAELAEHGDLGLGTLNGLDGEMIALDGALLPGRRRGPRSTRSAPRGADAVRGRHPLRADGRGGDRRAARRTTSCSPRLDELIPAGAASCAIRLDGRFELVRARSVPRQQPPYRPLTEVVAEQHVFELRRRRGDDARLPLPELRRGDRGRRLPPPLHRRGPRAAAATSSTRARRGLRARLDPSTTSTSSCRPGSTSATPASRRRPHAALEPGPRAARASAAAVEDPGLVAADLAEAGRDGGLEAGRVVGVEDEVVDRRTALAGSRK